MHLRFISKWFKRLLTVPLYVAILLCPTLFVILIGHVRQIDWIMDLCNEQWSNP